MTHFNLCDLFPNKIFTDFRFEVELENIEKEFEINDKIIIDFRHFKWIDLWSLIQLLFLISRYNSKPIYIYLLSPEVYVEEDKKRNASAILKFLSDMEFLNRAIELNSHCILFLQDTKIVNKVKEVQIEDINDLSIIYSESYSISETARHLIPITKVDKDTIEFLRERLYLESKQIFDRFLSESIVQQAGIGDCLLAELVSNVIVHGGGEGFLALRAVGGLKRLQKTDPKKYNSGKLSRQNHPLEDWRHFFSERYNDGFFELIVADQGKGISSTIVENNQDIDSQSKDKNLNAITHHRLKHALDPFTSSLSKEERKKEGLTEFTGLGAVSHVLNSHNGYLMIREKKSRHIFYGKDSNHKFFTKLSIKRGQKLKFDREEEVISKKKELSMIKGTVLTAIVPITGSSIEERIEYLTPKNLPDNDIQNSFETVKFFKIVDGDQHHKCYSEVYFIENTWKFVANEINNLPDNFTTVLIDLKNVSVDKNRTWTGISLVKKICDDKNLGLFLCGLDNRIAIRLEENSSIDSNTISKGNPWIIIGFGDDDKFYLFGIPDSDPQEKLQIQSVIRTAFNSFNDLKVEPKIEKLLNDSNYITWVPNIEDKLGNMLPKLRANYSILRLVLRKSYKEILEHHIKSKSAWIKDAPVQLIGGDIVSPYLCIHSVTQISGIYPDIARLIRIISNEFDFDFVLNVGTAAKTSIAKDLSFYRTQRLPDSTNEENKVVYYSYQDYFSFDHGEDTKSVIKPNSKVLIIVDGIRKSEHCEQAIDHVLDCGATVVAVVAVIDLNGKLELNLNGIPVRFALSLPVSSIHDASPIWKEDPYSHKLIKYDKTSKNKDIWNVFYDQTRAYKLVETFGIIQKGHSVFLGRHVRRSFVLSYLFHSKTTLSIELSEHITSIINTGEVDTIIYPEHSPIGKLVEDIISYLPNSSIEIVICRRAVYPGKSSSYTLNHLGTDILSKSRSILVIDDQVYTGNSLKNMVNLCYKNSPELERINVYVVIESMLKSERKLFASSFQHPRNIDNSNIELNFTAFMRFPVNKYWDGKSCPICELRTTFQKNKNLKNQFVESNYANRRLLELEPKLLDYETQSRKQLSRLGFAQRLERENQEPVLVTTFEGYELFCEVAYVEGDIGWLIDGLKSGMPNVFPPDVIISVLELLSQDISLLFRIRLFEKLIDNLIGLLDQRELKGKKLGRLLESLSKFPLYFLKGKLWNQIWDSVLDEPPETFYLCYSGAHILLQEIARRPFHSLRDTLLKEFDLMSDESLKILPDQVEFKKKEQMIHCLQRSYQFEQTITFSWLVSNISQILVYPIKKNQLSHHQLLYRDLIQLAEVDEVTNSTHFIATIQMLGHLQYCFEQLKIIFPEQAKPISDHNDYPEILKQIDKLQKLYPFDGNIGNKKDEICCLADSILNFLFREKKPSDSSMSFQQILEKFLIRYTRTIEQILEPLTKINNKKIKINYNQEIRKDVKLIFDDDSIRLVFEEVAKNLDNFRDRWLKENETLKSGNLYSGQDYNFKLPVEINFKYKSSSIEIEICNECFEEDIKKADEGGRAGIRQIRLAMEKFGYLFEPESKKFGTKVLFIQNFELRSL